MSWFVLHFAQIIFYLLAACAVAGGVGVIGFRNPINAALSLLGTFLAVAGLFVLMHAEFLAAVQIFVYAGGVMVLFLFVIMLVRVRTIPQEPQYLRSLAPAAVGVGGLLAVLVGVGLWAAARTPLANPAVLHQVQGVSVGNTEAVGWNLYRDYLLPFEVVSIVLLVAMIGAIVLGRKEPEKEGGA
jgi:NADH-quinone oxidoreductase subunit J